MNPIDLPRFRESLRRGVSWQPARTLVMCRHFDGEELFEVHHANQADFPDVETFLAMSAQNEYGVTAPAGAHEQFESANTFAYLANRPVADADLAAMHELFAPLAAAVPPRESIQGGVILFEDWNEKWWVLEAGGGELYSVRWSTSA